MALGMSISQGLEQTLALQLTPSQKLSLEILQLNLPTLEQRIQEELEANPLLEIVEDKPDENLVERMETSEGLDDRDDYTIEKEGRVDTQEYMDSYWGESDYTASSERYQRDSDDEDDFVDTVAARSSSLEEDLSEQLEFLNPDASIRDSILYLLSHLDDRGYLNHNLEDLLQPEEGKEYSLEILQTSLEYIQAKLDPPGLGARNLKECMQLQLRHLGNDFYVEEEILEHYFDELLNNRLDVIAHKLDIDVERVKESLELFRTMEMRPASSFTETVAAPLRPDAVIQYESPEEEGDIGKFRIRLEKRGIPELVVNSGTVYKSSKLSEQDKKFILEKGQSGRALVEAIRRRNQTLMLVINAICQRQLAFFEEGRNGLKPLLMQDIAKDVDLSAATVTRTVKDKVVQTDHGIFPLKYFFGLKKITTASGEEQERDEILQALKKIVDEEDKKKPLTDEAIRKQLADLNFNIKTRTVNKYRNILDIPSRSKRKVY